MSTKFSFSSVEVFFLFTEQHGKRGPPILPLPIIHYPSQQYTHIEKLANQLP